LSASSRISAENASTRRRKLAWLAEPKAQNTDQRQKLKNLLNVTTCCLTQDLASKRLVGTTESRTLSLHQI